ncbi:tetratricopeptide repeat protein [bacterium CPR1]|nr:tetratricopeptide repeat protein [bacterium CPR1]
MRIALLIVMLMALAQAAPTNSEIRQLLDQGRFQEASEAARSVLASEPQNVPICLLLGDALLGLGQWDEAQKHYTQALELAPRDSQVCLHVGQALETLGDSSSSRRPRFRS